MIRRNVMANSSVRSSLRPLARVLAYYLPQYHPVPENDRWWGPGFSEWTNVARARPLFPTHYQPHLPGELGFYDLRTAETREAQAALAASYGVEGFCYYHYWFGDGRRLLERPFAEVLRLGEPDFPFCLAWANQSWTGVWHGAPNRLLVRQTYPGVDDDRQHFDEILPALCDSRAILVDGRPLFIVYRPQDLPDAGKFVDQWQQMAVRAGLPGLYLAGRSTGEFIPTAHGFDSNVASQVTPPFQSRLASQIAANLRPDWIMSAVTRRSPRVPAVYLYSRWSEFIPWLVGGEGVCFPTVVPNWDNTPRAGRAGTVYHGSTPEVFKAQVEIAVHLVSRNRVDERLVFVQAWNEWGEGNCLEPDRRHGRGYLEALRDAVES